MKTNLSWTWVALLAAAGCGLRHGGAAPSHARADAASSTPAQERVSSEPGVLTAGHWRDLDHWDFWEGVVKGPFKTAAGEWGLDLSARIPVRVTDGERPAVDLAVVLLDANERPIGHARTDVRGRAELFPSLVKGARGPFSIEVSDGQRQAFRGPVAADGEPVMIALPGAAAPPPLLDLMFVVDTTGSMGDELSYLSTELRSVIGRVKRDNEALAVRLSTNFYRDQGDAYVVRSHPFSTDVRAAVKAIGDESAGGGGDFPEAVEEALADAIDAHAWSPRARARLLFLVLDAPPHRDAQRLDLLAKVTAAAAAKGVRIIPVASSGVDQSTEALLRQLSIATAGSYTFLTDHSGVGNPHLAPTIGQYRVEKLNDLMVRLIDEAVRAPAEVASR